MSWESVCKMCSTGERQIWKGLEVSNCAQMNSKLVEDGLFASGFGLICMPRRSLMMS